MRLSIVIVNWNTSDLLGACLRSIGKYPPPMDYEVIVVDNASADFDAKSLGSEFPEVKLITNSTNAGYAKGNNQAIVLSRGNYILLLNPDTEVTENAVDSLVRFMELHPKAAAAGARLVRPDGSVERSVRGFPYPGPIAWEYIGLSKLLPHSSIFGAYRMSSFAYDKVAEVDQPMGSGLILNRKATDDIGLFDEDFPIFFNEVDWLYRAKQQGYEVYFTPDATIVHHGAAGTKQAARGEMARQSHESLARFYEKHFKGRIFAPLYYFTIACISISRMIRGRA